MKRGLCFLLVIVLASGCQEASQPLSPSESEEALFLGGAGASGIIPGRFIVTVQEAANPASVARDHGVAPDFVYGHALTGFAGKISEAARQGLLRDARVVLVEPDGIATTQETTQSNVTWGLDRIDQSNLPLSGTFGYTNTGNVVTAYIIDTGIRFSHGDFGGRAVSGYDAVDGGSADDCNGHGTHVAGTVGGNTWGVAKGVGLVAVRVLNCNGSGSWSGVIAGVDYVTAQHDPGESSVANMSLGGGANTSVDNAVRNSIADGVSYAIAAGNGNIVGRAQDACKYSPARVAEAMTIGATTNADKKASWSNYGKCVDFFAPGVGITSAWNTSDGATQTISGTSMATPHTAGVAALYLQGNPGASPGTVRNALYSETTKGIVTSSKTANNHLLFTDY